MEKMYVFYTDDDPDDISIFSDAVKAASNEVQLLTQFDGGDLLRLLQNPPPRPGMIFLDWNMPGKNGAEVLGEIKSHPKLIEIPIIIFSTSENQEDIDCAFRLKADRFITKPNSFKEIIQIIKHCLTLDWENISRKEEDFVFKLN